jgi:murein DD-endopeptidase / murein LD-carboxypeptidase
MTLAEKFAAAATRCVGTRFRLQGRDPATGLDCVGLIAWCAASVGLPVSDSADYILETSAVRLVPHLQASGFAARDDLQPRVGDVLIFDLHNSLNHVAVCTRAGMVHADIRFRRVVEHRIDDYWQAHLAGLYYIGGQ